MNSVGSRLARAAAWLVEPPSVAATPPEEAPTVQLLGAPGPKKLHREPTIGSPAREARVGPMELRARPMELRLVPAEPVPLPARPVIAVVGLAPGCGATTFARALAATLARRDHSGAAIVASAHEAVGSYLATRSATRLATRQSGARAAGRLCLTSLDAAAQLAQLAPLVLDLPSADTTHAALARVAILIAPGDAEPALAELAAQTLDAITVVTSTDDPSRWEGRAFLILPRSRLGARRAAAGWEPRGAFGAAVARVADACEERACA